MNPPLKFNQGPFSEIICETNRLVQLGINLEEILDYLFRSLAGRIPYDRMGIGLLSEDNTMRLVWVKSQLPVRYIRRNYSVSLTGSSLNIVMETGQPRIIPDLRVFAAVNPHSRSTQLILKDGILSSLTCPLRAKNKPTGAVFFSSAKANTYTMDHADAFMSIAGEISILMDHARLQKYFEAEQLRERSIRHLLHDLRSPLSVMHSYLELANSEEWFSTANPQAANVCHVLRRNTAHLLELLKELTELRANPRINNDHEFVEENLQHFLKEIEEIGKDMSSRKEIAFNFVIKEGCPEAVLINRVKLIRALENLLSNAVKFSDRGTTISFVAKVSGEQLIFEVTDQGQGIETEELPLLFHEFGKTSTRPTEGESSTGLGLSIAQQIAKLHGGEITVQSKVDEGSTFTMSIPLRIFDSPNGQKFGNP